MQTYILIIEDDNEINQMLTELLQSSGYTTKSAYSGTEALLCLEKETPQAVLLDLMLPGLSGEELLQQIRAKYTEIAVLVTSAKDAVRSRVELLRAGADDYIVKPFDTDELLARLEAVLRRKGAAHGSPHPAKAVTFKDIVMEPERHRVTVSGQEIALTKREYMILELLISNPQKVFILNPIPQTV